ncbi:MAG: ABC transporter ATP-binding protein [Candidatus Dormibacteraeota bacterium]|nr:ABC transporter ATP-binding protein [Candidatus Dormibacteraeota bacterium]
MLSAEVRLRLGRLDLEAELHVAAGEVVALLGPNGAGKTTLLRALAGLVPLASGRVVLDGVALEDPERRLRVSTELRPVSMVFQDYLLFPHLSVLENVAFGLRAHGTRHREALRQAAAALARLGLDGLSAARPGTLSGGQQQRVALARALATTPRLLLLDEPLSALDVSARAEVRRDLRLSLRQSGAANLVVTHDPLEAVALADRLLVLEAGRIVQAGTAAAVTGRPRSAYVADLVGVNLLRGTAQGSAIEVEGGGRLEAAGAVEGPVFAAIAPQAVSIWRGRPEGSPRNVWPGRVEAVERLGDRVRVRVQASPDIVAEVTPAAVTELGLADGGEVWVSVKATEVTVYPA